MTAEFCWACPHGYWLRYWPDSLPRCTRRGVFADRIPNERVAAPRPRGVDGRVRLPGQPDRGRLRGKAGASGEHAGRLLPRRPRHRLRGAVPHAVRHDVQREFVPGHSRHRLSHGLRLHIQSALHDCRRGRVSVLRPGAEKAGGPARVCHAHRLSAGSIRFAPAVRELRAHHVRRPVQLSPGAAHGHRARDAGTVHHRSRRRLHVRCDRAGADHGHLRHAGRAARGGVDRRHSGRTAVARSGGAAGHDVSAVRIAGAGHPADSGT